MAEDPLSAAREQIAAAIDARRQAYARPRSRWGDGLEGQRLPHYRIVVTEQTRHGRTKRHTFVLDPFADDDPEHWGRETEKPIRAHGELVTFTEPLRETVSLARGVDMPSSVLVVILEALVSDARHSVDLADIKVVVSQLGSRLGTLDTLSAEQRRRAEPALFAEVLSRCTTIGPVSIN